MLNYNAYKLRYLCGTTLYTMNTYKVLYNSFIHYQLHRALFFNCNAHINKLNFFISKYLNLFITGHTYFF